MKNWKDCENLLRLNNAPEQLIKHLEIVSSVALMISNYVLTIDILHNQELVVCGAGLHDFGKIIYHEELSKPGSNHEEEGKKLLLEQGIDLSIAECCVSHSQWNKTDKLEELLIALADKLWKGNRNQELELKVIDLIAEKKNTDRWSVYSEIDLFFESIADEGTTRLEKSKVSTLKYKG